MRRAKKKTRKRSMRRSRLETVKRIEQRRGSDPVAPPDAASAINPATHKQIQELRHLGLSVSENAPPERLRTLRQEFDLVSGYAQDVFRALSSEPQACASLPQERLDHFAAMLFGDGQLVDAITSTQRTRQGNPDATPITKTPPFKPVAALLKQQFSDLRPRRRWWSRLLAR